MRRVEFTAHAQIQYRAAYRWYEAAQTGLGEQFADQIEQTLQRVDRNPAQFKIAAKQYRRILLKRFPYEVFYEFNDDQIVIYAVFHTSQNPERWETQLP